LIGPRVRTEQLWIQVRGVEFKASAQKRAADVVATARASQ
jgi:hypothetical protein